MTNLKKEIIQVREAAQALVEKTEALKIRFHDFLVANDPAGFALFSVEKNWPKAPDYEMDLLDDRGPGLTFEMNYMDYDCEVSRYFVMPEEYLDAPDAWEKRVLDELTKDKALARKVLDAVFEGKADDLEPKSISRGLLNSGINDRYLLVYLGEAFKKFAAGLLASSFASPTSLAVYDRTTGNIYLMHSDRQIFELNMKPVAAI